MSRALKNWGRGEGGKRLQMSGLNFPVLNAVAFP